MVCVCVYTVCLYMQSVQLFFPLMFLSLSMIRCSQVTNAEAWKGFYQYWTIRGTFSADFRVSARSVTYSCILEALIRHLTHIILSLHSFSDQLKAFVIRFPVTKQCLYIYWLRPFSPQKPPSASPFFWTLLFWVLGVSFTLHSYNICLQRLSFRVIYLFWQPYIFLEIFIPKFCLSWSLLTFS